MIIPVEIMIALIFLVILSILDIKTFNLKEGFIPSVLTTSFLIVIFISSGASSLFAGALAFFIGMLLVDLDLFGGIADWKIFVACGMTMPTFVMIAVFGLILTMVAYGYKFIIIKKFKRLEEIPFIPAILVAYCITWLMFI